MTVHSETVVVHRRVSGKPDAHGISAVTSTDQTIDQCTVQPLSVRAAVQLGIESPTQGRWHLSTAEPEDWIAKGDSVTWRGVEYKVDGFPQTFWQELPHTELVLTLTEG
jgi:hypothetical protein